MLHSNILILTRGSRLSAAQSLAESLTGLLPHNLRPRFEISAIESYDASDTARSDTAIAIVEDVEDDEHSPWREVAITFEEHRVPLLALVAEDIGQGLGWAPAGALRIDHRIDLSELAGRLEAVLYQQRTVKRLYTDLQVARRFQGGLRGEISRMHDELQLAALVQQEILPRSLPELHGIRFGAMWRPANYVSGDIYDIARLDEDHIGVFIADAVGHGVPAALLTMVIHRALRTKEVTDSGYRLVPPSEALARLNAEMIRRQGDTTRFATAIYALVNCRTREMTMAGAGHPAAMVLHPGREPYEIEAAGGLLGVFEDETYPETKTILEVDDRVLFYSDGFEVAFPESAETERGMKMPTNQYRIEFASLTDVESPDDMIRQLSMRIDAQPGSLHQVDDLTIIAMHAGALGGTGSATKTAATSPPTQQAA